MMVQSKHNLFNVSIRQVCKIPALGEVLSDQAVGIFIGYTFPGRLRMSKIYIGIENADPEIRKAIKKGTTLDKIRNAQKIAEKVGIETWGRAISGHLHETRETGWRTIKFPRSIKECQGMFLNITCPYPITKLYINYYRAGRNEIDFQRQVIRFIRYG